MGIRTRLGDILYPLNKDYGAVGLEWGTTGIMGVVMALLLVFLLILIELYNSSLLLSGVNVDWMNF
jgi:photosystem II PsbH protein